MKLAAAAKALLPAACVGLTLGALWRTLVVDPEAPRSALFTGAVLLACLGAAGLASSDSRLALILLALVGLGTALLLAHPLAWGAPLAFPASSWLAHWLSRPRSTTSAL